METTGAMLWQELGWPLARVLLLVSVGLLVANFIEALDWTRKMARLAVPLIRAGHLSDTAGASFSMAFFSGVAANTMLAEGFHRQRLGKKELIFANLFNSLPTYLLHLPTIFFLAAPLIKGAAFIYVGLTLLAAFLRTAAIILLGRWLLPGRGGEECIECRLARHEERGWRDILARTWRLYVTRIRRVAMFIVPIYTAVFLLHRMGLFARFEQFLSRHVSFLSWLPSKSLGIVVLQAGADPSAGLAAAGALLEAGTLDERQIILALLAGNVLSSPLRAVRHQFPYYAGIFSPRLALELIFCNQSFRIVSMVVVGLVYFFLG